MLNYDQLVRLIAEGGIALGTVLGFLIVILFVIRYLDRRDMRDGDREKRANERQAALGELLESSMTERKETASTLQALAAAIEKNTTASEGQTALISELRRELLDSNVTSRDQILGELKLLRQSFTGEQDA